MAPAADLPCDGVGACMICKAKPSESESLVCNLCTTPWHVPCLSAPPVTMASAAAWECPDCSGPSVASTNVVSSGVSSGLIASVRAIEADGSLTEQEKARRRQELLGGGVKMEEEEEEEEEEEGEEEMEVKKTKRERGDVLDLLDQKFNCSFCMQLPERPVTTPCGHNFCLKCFQKWVGQGKNTCAKCRAPIPPKMASLPRINSALVVAIRMAKTAKLATSGRSTQIYYFMHNEDRPDKAFTTERAKKAGKANACSGQIFVTIPSDYFGPISAEHDPKRNQGVLVGETWEDRMECRQWGVHFPHVAGIAGQSDYGAQSVALSGGYEDDEDHGEWFLYTGSGGRDLSGNKRTNKEHAFDQKFEKNNEALRVSCRKGYPVRVVRSHKEKRSSYAPETGVRYDGVYRIEKCWRKVGSQGFKMCRYLFVRCDNEPAPWTSDEHGDQPRPLPVIKELKDATDITERKESPAWDYDGKNGWKWMKPPPPSKKPVVQRDPKDGMIIRKVIRKAHNVSVKGKLLKEFSCLICHKVMKFPLTTPCAHNFCKLCLLDSFGGLSFVKERTRENGRTLRAQKIINKCPCCPTDISEFLQNPHVNRDMMELIESLQTGLEENIEEASQEEHGENAEEANDVIEKPSDEASDPDAKRMMGSAKGNVAKEKNDKKRTTKTLDDKSAVEQCNETKSNGEEYDAAEDKKLNTTVEDHVENSCLKLEGPATRATPLSSRRKKQISGEKRPAKKAKKGDNKVPQDGENCVSMMDKMIEAAAGDSEVNARTFEQADRSKVESQSPNAKCDSRSPLKLKKLVPSPVASVWTRSMESITGSGVCTRNMSSKAGSASPIAPNKRLAL